MSDTTAFCMHSTSKKLCYYHTYNVSGTLVGNKIVDHCDVVGASPVGAAPITSSFKFGIWCDLHYMFDGSFLK